MDYLKSIAKIRKLFEAADYVGVKTVDTEDDPEQFLIKIFSCRPALIRLFNFLLVNRMAHHATRFAAPP